MSLNLLRETLPGMGEAVGFVEQRLRSALLDATSEAKEIFFHLLDGGGKRIRPVLTLLSASLFTQDVSEVVPVAAAMELIHMATLVHDDVIDVADTAEAERPSLMFGVISRRYWQVMLCWPGPCGCWLKWVFWRESESFPG